MTILQSFLSLVFVFCFSRLFGVITPQMHPLQLKGSWDRVALINNPSDQDKSSIWTHNRGTFAAPRTIWIAVELTGKVRRRRRNKIKAGKTIPGANKGKKKMNTWKFLLFRFLFFFFLQYNITWIHLGFPYKWLSSQPRYLSLYSAAKRWRFLHLSLIGFPI